MALKIDNVLRNSLASSLPIKKGYTIVSINNTPIYDILDLLFYTQKDTLTIQYVDENKNVLFCQVKNKFDKPLGIEVELPECQNCINNCIFCFVDQMPSGLRRALYIKDDDYIYSFFYGNFITLTNLNKDNIDKILRQHISPLYVSVHTTDSELHKKMLRYNTDFNILDTLRIFQKAGIDIHSQIVLVPEINDGNALKQSLTDLILMENVKSIGIVPIGLTKYRNNLTNIQKFTKERALSLIEDIEQLRKTNAHIYCADELYIMADLPIPDDTYYGDYDQIENGIGMTRKSLENWKYFKKKYISFLNNSHGNPVLITSISGYSAIMPIIKDIQNNLINKEMKICIVTNYFFGEEVTVTGLLTWQDIRNQVILNELDYPVFSSNVFNFEMYTIDDYHISEIKKEFEKKIVVVDELFNTYKVY